MKKITVNELLQKTDLSGPLNTAKLLQMVEKPVYDKDGKRTDKVDCYEATVILPEFGGAIVSVKVNRKPKIENISDMPDVCFNGITANAWVRDEKYIELSFRADSMEEC